MSSAAADFAVGDYVEAPVTADGAPKIAVGVVRAVVPGSGGSESLLHVDFGPGVKAAPTAETPRGGPTNVLVWKTASDLKKVAGGLKEDEANNDGVASPLRDDSVRKFPQASAAPTAGPSTSEAATTSAAAQEASEPSLEEAEEAEEEQAPTMCDEAAWTLAAGLYAVVSTRRPFLTVCYLLFFALAKSLYNDAQGLPDPIGACGRLTEARAAAPGALRELVVDGRLPFNLNERFNVSAADLRDYHHAFHTIVESLQRTTPGATQQRNNATVAKKNATKSAAKKQPKATANANQAKEEATPAPSPSLTAADAEACRHAGDLLLTVAALTLVIGTTAFPFTNACANVERFNKECKAMLYIWSVVIVLFVPLKYVDRKHFAPIDGPALQWVYDNVVRMHSVTTFTMEQPWVTAAINLTLGLIALPFKMVFFGLEAGGTKRGL